MRLETMQAGRKMTICDQDLCHATENRDSLHIIVETITKKNTKWIFVLISTYVSFSPQNKKRMHRMLHELS